MPTVQELYELWAGDSELGDALNRSLEPRGLDQERVAPLVQRADADVDRTLHVDEHAGEAETALLDRLELLAAPLDLRVDERRNGRLQQYSG